MALTPDQIDDFVLTTLPLFKRHKWTDIALEYQHYTSSKMMTKKVTERGGEQISYRLKTRNTGNARNTGMFAQDITKVEDVMAKAQVPWTMQTTNYSYDIYEDFFQSDRETIIRELVIREHDCLSDLAELNEENLWDAPVDAADKRPMGIPFWLQKNATANEEGDFLGGNPNGFPGGAGGLSSLDYPRWRNWTFGYRAISRDDMVRKTKRAITFTKFVPPVPHPELGYGGTDHEIFTTYRVQEPLERLAETRNDNLGRDLARFMNQVTIGGIPVMWVPFLEENDLTDPLYGVNWRVFRPFVKRNCNMRRSRPKVAARQHSVREIHIDTWMNYLCVNRRMTFVGSLIPAS